MNDPLLISETYLEPCQKSIKEPFLGKHLKNF